MKINKMLLVSILSLASLSSIAEAKSPKKADPKQPVPQSSSLTIPLVCAPYKDAIVSIKNAGYVPFVFGKLAQGESDSKTDTNENKGIFIVVNKDNKFLQFFMAGNIVCRMWSGEDIKLMVPNNGKQDSNGKQEEYNSEMRKADWPNNDG